MSQASTPTSMPDLVNLLATVGMLSDEQKKNSLLKKAETFQKIKIEIVQKQLESWQQQKRSDEIRKNA